MITRLPSYIRRTACNKLVKPPWTVPFRSFAMAGNLPRYQTLAELQKVYEGGTTVHAVTQQYLDAIEALKDLNAVTCINPKAVEEAQKLDVSSYVVSVKMRAFPAQS